MADLYKEALSEDTNIWVAPYGSDSRGNGSFESPYRTVEMAVSKITSTKLTVILMPGAYTMAASVNITVDGTRIIGLCGGVDIDGTACTTRCFKTIFGASNGTKDFTMEKVSLDHAALVGIQIDNVGATAKVNVYLKDVDLEGSGNSLDIDRGGSTGQAVRVYATDCYFEGAINMVVEDHGDRLRLSRCTLDTGIVTDSGAYTLELLLESCIIPLDGITGGASQQIVYFSGCTTQSGASVNVYAGAVATDVQTQGYVICDHEN